jgi:hypothetical protein
VYDFTSIIEKKSLQFWSPTVPNSIGTGAVPASLDAKR